MAQKLERNMSDAVRYVVLQAARELLPKIATEAEATEGNVDYQRR